MVEKGHQETLYQNHKKTIDHLSKNKADRVVWFIAAKKTFLKIFEMNKILKIVRELANR